MLFDWSDEKDEELRQTRGVGFQDIVLAIQDGGLLGIYQHPNSTKYPHQFILKVLFSDYVFIVPCVQENEVYFLKTLYPSRKATREHRHET